MTPAFLTPGYVGLYQVNFVVPEPPAGYQNRCGLGALRSNLTVSIGVLYSYDGAGICVEVPVGASATSSAGRGPPDSSGRMIAGMSTAAVAHHTIGEPSSSQPYIHIRSSAGAFAFHAPGCQPGTEIWLPRA